MNKQFVESAAKQAKFLSGKVNDWLHLIDQLEQNEFEVLSDRSIVTKFIF